MPRQLVRLNEVRRPLSTSDQYTSAQIQGAEANSVTAEDYLQYILSQIRLIQGTSSWKTLPAASLATLSQALAPSSESLAQLTALATEVAQLAAQVATLATQASLEVQAQALDTLSANIGTQLQSYGLALAQAQAQLAGQAAQIAALVTPQGLSNALASSTLFDQPLTGVRNNQNRIFVTAQNYSLPTLRVYLNGMRLLPGALNDYTPAQSAQGLGYDQIVLSSAQAAPAQQDLLTADFIPS